MPRKSKTRADIDQVAVQRVVEKLKAEAEPRGVHTKFATEARATGGFVLIEADLAIYERGFPCVECGTEAMVTNLSVGKPAPRYAVERGQLPNALIRVFQWITGQLNPRRGFPAKQDREISQAVAERVLDAADAVDAVAEVAGVVAEVFADD